MKLKRLLIMLLAILMIAASAQAGTWYVYTQNGKSLNLRSPENNAVIGNIPYGTKLETNDMLSTETAAYVTWGGKSGFVKWQFLVKDPPSQKNSKTSATVTAAPKASTQAAEQLRPTAGDGEITVQTFGAYVEYSSKSTGKYSAISFNSPVKVKVTADLPKGKSIDYWVIDGVRYDFKSKIPTSFTLDNITDSVIVEAVAKGQRSQTLLSEADIRAMRTGATLIVDTKHAKLCHIRTDDKGAGGWITSFDFTDDYTNRATKQWEEGGQVTVRVKATVPKGKKISYWKFNDLKIDFDKNVTEMIVRTLNVSKTYEPIFGKTTQKTTTERKEMCHIITRSCTFTGGGYTNATVGDVPSGTKVKFTSDVANPSGWYVNGTQLMRIQLMPVPGKKNIKIKVPVQTHTIQRTITKDTSVYSTY